MYKFMVVEDDPESADQLKQFIGTYASSHDAEIDISWAPNASDVAADSTKWDLIFLDIDLPGYDGLEAASLIRSYDAITPIIFVTNLAQYAVRGYEVDALDFIVKPFSYKDVSMRLDKAMRLLENNVGRIVAVSTADGTRLLHANDILWAEVSGHYLVIHTAKSEYRMRESIARFEESLAPEPFVRISNHEVVNIEVIDRVQGNELVLVTGQTLYFSRSRRKDAVATILEHIGRSR
ncbi:MAG: LytR/AlgR family response regulator transcription factor [Olsenella sp.]